MGITNYNKVILWGKKATRDTWFLAANYVYKMTNIKIYVDYITCLSLAPESEKETRSQNCVDEEKKRDKNL